MTKNSKIVFLTDLIEQRLRKESEIKFYEEQLKEIQDKLFFLRKEQELTVTIIDILGFLVTSIGVYIATRD